MDVYIHDEKNYIKKIAFMSDQQGKYNTGLKIWVFK